MKKYPIFNYGDSIIEVVNDYVYLGVTTNYDNKFAKAIRKQLDQGRRAQFSLLVKSRKLDLPIDVQCILFDKTVIPVLLYGSEVWGFSSINMLESFHRKYLKKILKLRPSTPNCMIYGEVGKLPLQITVDKNMINYWLRLLNKDEHTVSIMVDSSTRSYDTRSKRSIHCDRVSHPVPSGMRAAWHDMAWSGMAWHGVAWHGIGLY